MLLWCSSFTDFFSLAYYILVWMFEFSVAAVRGAIDTLRNNGVNAFVLDLRDNRWLLTLGLLLLNFDLAGIIGFAEKLKFAAVVVCSQKELRLPRCGEFNQRSCSKHFIILQWWSIYFYSKHVCICCICDSSSWTLLLNHYMLFF